MYQGCPQIRHRTWKGTVLTLLRRAAKPLIITAVVAWRGDLVVKVSETGTIQPVDQVNVESKAPGRLLSIPITEGQRIRRGQLIAVVDRSQLDPQIAGSFMR